MSRLDRRNQLGFTIIEAVLTTLLVGVFLSVLAGLTSSLRRVTIFSEQRDQVGLARSVLNGLRSELSEAVIIDSPKTTAVVSEISLKRLVPESLAPNLATTSRLLSPPGTRVGYYWDPVKTDYLESLKYDLQGEILRRQINVENPSPIATVESLKASRPEPGLFELEMEVLTPKGRERLKMWVDRP